VTSGSAAQPRPYRAGRDSHLIMCVNAPAGRVLYRALLSPLLQLTDRGPRGRNIPHRPVDGSVRVSSGRDTHSPWFAAGRS